LYKIKKAFEKDDVWDCFVTEFLYAVFVENFGFAICRLIKKLADLRFADWHIQDICVAKIVE